MQEIWLNLIHMIFQPDRTRWEKKKKHENSFIISSCHVLSNLHDFLNSTEYKRRHSVDCLNWFNCSKLEVQNNIYWKSPFNNPNFTLMKWLMTISKSSKQVFPLQCCLVGQIKRLKLHTSPQNPHSHFIKISSDKTMATQALFGFVKKAKPGIFRSNTSP